MCFMTKCVDAITEKIQLEFIIHSFILNSYAEAGKLYTSNSRKYYPYTTRIIFSYEINRLYTLYNLYKKYRFATCSKANKKYSLFMG